MTKLDWKSITREDVIKAIELFLRENPEYPSPRSTYLIYNGMKLPAKHIRGMAYQVAHNQEISKQDYAGGMETVRFFKRLGFEMFHIEKAETTKEHAGHKSKEGSPSGNAVAKTAAEVKAVEAVHPTPEVVQTVPCISRIKIPSKAVIEQKNALQLILNKMFDGDIVCEKTYGWLKTPSTVKDEYIPLVEALTKYRGNKDFAKKNVVLRCDFVCEGKKLIIEYDERQHFSEARRISLESYRNLPLCFDRDLWMKACSDVQARDSQPANRDETRAFYDSTRDIEAAKHGYTLVRIMHGQIDFENADAADKLKGLLQQSNQADAAGLSGIKVALYLQTNECKCQKKFDRAMECIKRSDADILVFPEFGWVPFWRLLNDSDIFNQEDLDRVYDKCIELSENLGRAVIISSASKRANLFSVYANAKATDNETRCALYVKHTMTLCSAFECKEYKEKVPLLFSPIVYKAHRIGMTICYDCNHALFSRMYGVQGVDIIINSTGGNVVYDKWHKYNQARAIENRCYTFVTMGGDGRKDKVNSYVYGFTPTGKDMKPHLLNGSSDKSNIPGGIYIYDTAERLGGLEPESSLNQVPTENKYQDFFLPVGNIATMLQKSNLLECNLYVYQFKQYNIVFCIADEDAIFSAESFLPLMYSEKLKGLQNKRYVLVCRYKNLSKHMYECQLSVVLKVRAMENFCAVILESDLTNNCYQAGKSKTVQVVAKREGQYGLDLSRMTGPEAIWKNKNDDFKASWRTNFEWLARECKYIEGHHQWSER